MGVSEQRCPGCHHPAPLHTMECPHRNPLYPVLRDLITDLRSEHKQSPVGTCVVCTQYWPCDTADYVTLAEVRLKAEGPQ